MDYETIIREFLTFYWEDRCRDIEETILGVQIKPRHPGELLYQSGLASNLQLLAKAATGELPREEMVVGEVYEVCQSLAESLFSVPGGLAHYTIPDEFADTPLGGMWWRALLWVQGDELITITEAAKLAGTSEQAISQRIDRGSLHAYTDPEAPSRQGRRKVRRSDIV